jgi:FAD:protein FMN transferase
MQGGYHTFAHEAMATSFAVHIAGHPAAYAGQAAAAAFRELDRLEGELSRYVESSDIARANRLAEGGEIMIGEDAVRCLLLAARVSHDTVRAFDPSYASVFAAGVGAEAPAFALDAEGHRLISLVPRLHLDLGAIGKGYALDRLAAVLEDWSVGRACLESGGSTALALDPPDGEEGWPVGVGDPPAERLLALRRRALSGSGIAVKGAHVIDRRTGRPALRRTRVWALAETAALSDALSTAFFVMDDAAIAAYCARDPAVTAFVARSDGTLGHYGPAV